MLLTAPVGGSVVGWPFAGGARATAEPTSDAVARFGGRQHLVGELLAEKEDHRSASGKNACDRLGRVLPVQQQLAAVGKVPLGVEVDHRGEQSVFLARQAIEMLLV